MNPEPNTPRRLRRWFALIAISPALLSIALTALASLVDSGEQELGWIVSGNLLIALPLNGICSAYCAAHLSRVKTGRVQTGWLVLGALGFFCANMALAFAGCAAGAFVIDAATR